MGSGNYESPCSCCLSNMSPSNSVFCCALYLLPSVLKTLYNKCHHEHCNVTDKEQPKNIWKSNLEKEMLIALETFCLCCFLQISSPGIFFGCALCTSAISRRRGIKTATVVRIRPSLNIYFTWHDISVPSRGISMKLGISSLNCWKGFQGQRSRSGVHICYVSAIMADA